MKPKVLIILDTAFIGGPGKGLLQFVAHADKEKFDFLFGVFEYSSQKSKEFIEAVTKLGHPIRYMRQRFRFDPAAFLDARRIIKQESCSIVQSHGYKGHLIGMFLKLTLGVSWIAFSHGWTREDLKVRLYHLIDRITLRFCSLAVVVANDMYEEISRIKGSSKDVRLILNAVSAEEIPTSCQGQGLRKDLGIADGKFLIGCFGRLSSEKGQRILLKAFKNLLEGDDSLHLLIVGEGPEKGILEQEIKDYKIGNHVTMLPYTKCIGDYYQAVQLLVIPSISEGLPNVLLEAAVFGVPTVATQVGAVGEFIQHGLNGWIVQPGDVDALATQLAQVTSNRDKIAICGKRARESLYPKFDPRIRAEQITNLYQEVTQNEL